MRSRAKNAGQRQRSALDIVNQELLTIRRAQTIAPLALRLDFARDLRAHVVEERVRDRLRDVPADRDLERGA